jgi:hypothetical protein
MFSIPHSHLPHLRTHPSIYSLSYYCTTLRPSTCPVWGVSLQFVTHGELQLKILKHCMPVHAVMPRAECCIRTPTAASYLCALLTLSTWQYFLSHFKIMSSCCLVHIISNDLLWKITQYSVRGNVKSVATCVHECKLIKTRKLNAT